MQIQETILFKTSCTTTYIDWPHSNNLIKKIQELSKNNQNLTVQKSNSGGFQSQSMKNNSYDNEYIKILFEEFIKPCAKQTAKLWGIPSKMEDLTYWYNINYKWSYNREHYHDGSFLSGAFYLKVPKDSGKIVFLRSSTEYDRMQHIQSRFIQNDIKIDNPEINTHYWFYPYSGFLVLFPGHVSHYVDQNLTDESDEERISISFNF